MADPLSVASGIVGLLAAAGKVVEVLGPYISAAKDTPKIARAVNSEVVYFRIMLSALQALLDNLDTASSYRKQLIKIPDLQLMLTDGIFMFSELEASVLKITQSGSDRLVTRMQWARKEKDLAAALVRVEAFKNTTLMFLNMLQCDSDRQAAQTRGKVSAKLMKLLDNNGLLRRLETLEDSFDALSLIEPRRPVQSQSSVPSPSEHVSDMDDQTFYSMETARQSSENHNVDATFGQSEDSVVIPTFEFQAALDDSVPYRRTMAGTVDFSAARSVAASHTWSVFSGTSLFDISDLSRVAIPVFPQDISNSHHYEFMKPTTEKLYTAQRPTEAAIGRWASLVKRTPFLKELRFDIEFQVPLIFLCPPTNVRGPVKDAPVLFIDGSDESLDQTMSELPGVSWGPMREKSPPDIMRTSEAALASWVTLISALQYMENQSRAWQRDVLCSNMKSSNHRSSPPEGLVVAGPMAGVGDVLVAQGYTLAAGIQRKRRTWSSLPSTFQRPFATTTWCHTIELAAILGMYWKEFNRSQDIYQARGNNYTMTSSQVPGLGTVFTFRVQGRSHFESNRVIPKEEIKEICFGFVPTIFRSPWDKWRYRYPATIQPVPETLHLASANQIAQSLAAIGCNSFTSRLFLEDKTVSHIFPIVFEIIGMLAGSLHIKDSAFRALPNPTQHRWETTSHSLKLMMKAFFCQLNESRILIRDASTDSHTFIQRKIHRRAHEILEHICQSPDVTDNTPDIYRAPDIYLVNLLHESVADTTEILTAYNPRASPELPVGTFTTKLTLFDRIKDPQSILPEEREIFVSSNNRRKLTLLTLRSHIQVVLAGLNEGTTSETQVDFRDGDASAPPPAWDELDHLPPELKQAKLMEIYFRIVRPKVVTEVERSTGDLDASLPAQRHDHSTSTVIDDESGGDLNNVPLWKLETVSCEDIWYTLVFRSICWLMLHNFHPDDVQIPKSDLFGSRLPVYIA